MCEFHSNLLQLFLMGMPFPARSMGLQRQGDDACDSAANHQTPSSKASLIGSRRMGFSAAE
jgi:hypothetical protein